MPGQTRSEVRRYGRFNGGPGAQVNADEAAAEGESRFNGGPGNCPAKRTAIRSVTHPGIARQTSIYR